MPAYNVALYISSDLLKEAEALEWGASEGMTRAEVIKAIRDEIQCEGPDYEFQGVNQRELVDYMTYNRRFEPGRYRPGNALTCEL